MAKEQTYKAGDIFAIEIAPNEFAFGRVLLDVYKQGVEKGLIDIDDILALGNKYTILIELYKEVSDKKLLPVAHPQAIIPGIFTLDLEITDFEWEIIGHLPVDPTKIDFPESLTIEGATKGKFVKGEVSAIIDIPMEEIERIGIYPSIKAVVTISEFILCALGRQNEVREDRRPLRDLKNNDLRFSDHRDKIHALLPAEFKKPYYELAKEKGFDLARFYD